MTEMIQIFFIGLIAHMDFGSSNTAVMVAAPDHVAEMKIYHANGGVDGPFPLSKVLVTITRGLGNPIPDSSSISGKTPELGDITSGKCTVRQEIIDRKPDQSVTAYVNYAGGALTAPAFQEKLISFAHGEYWSKPHCAACGTVLNLKVNSGSWITILVAGINDPTNPVSYTVTASDIVVFRNAPHKPGTSTTKGSHFLHFYELLDNNCKTQDDVMISSQACTPVFPRCSNASPQAKAIKLKTGTLSPNLRIDWSRFNIKDFRDFIRTPDIECTNSHFP